MNLTIRGPYNNLGYGIACRNILRELSSQAECHYFPIGSPTDIYDQSEADWLKKLISSNHFLSQNEPSLTIWHEHSLIEQSIGKGPRIGYPFFELDLLDGRQRDNLNFMDKVFVASKWAKSVLENNNISVPIEVIPLGVDTEVFQPQSNKTDEVFRFLNIGKIEKRKGHDILCGLFNKAFTPEDNVELYLMWNNPFLSQENVKKWEQKYLSSPMGKENKIFFIPPVSTPTHVANIINQAHCGIFPTRAEGFGLPILETMACGIPIITTYCSALTEFCDDQNSFLVKPKEIEWAQDGIWFHKQGRWSSFTKNDVDLFITHMRDIYNISKTSSKLVNIYGIETAKKFTWKNTAQKIIDYI